MSNRPKIINRPWGNYREYARNEPCTVWKVEMEPGETGSLQTHEHFDELWIMLTDGAVVQVGDNIYNAKSGDEFYIPRLTKHRLSNPGAEQISMFEVAYGNVEDSDKIRFEDKYNRE